MGAARYNEEFRAHAVTLVLEKKLSPRQVGEELGVSTKSIRDWVERHANSQRGEYMRIKTLEQENRELRKELAHAKDTVDILKKTAAILSQR